jgi:hypothetical protein
LSFWESTFDRLLILFSQPLPVIGIQDAPPIITPPKYAWQSDMLQIINSRRRLICNSHLPSGNRIEKDSIAEERFHSLQFYSHVRFPVTNNVMIRIVLTLMMMAPWTGEILDVKGAFLHGDFEEGNNLYMGEKVL